MLSWKKQIHHKGNTKVICMLRSKTYSQHRLVKNYSPIISVKKRKMCFPSRRHILLCTFSFATEVKCHPCKTNTENTSRCRASPSLNNDTFYSFIWKTNSILYQEHSLKRRPCNQGKWVNPSKSHVLVKEGIVQFWWLVGSGVSLPTDRHDLPRALATARNGIWSMTVLRRTGPLWVRRGLFHTTRFTPDLLITLKPSERDRGLKGMEMKAWKLVSMTQNQLNMQIWSQ